MPQTRLVAKLKATASITTLVSTRIYPISRPQKTVLPCLVYQVLANNHVNAASDTTTTRELSLSIDCIAATYSAAWTLANVVRDAIAGWTDTAGGMWQITNESDGPPTLGPGQGEMQDYTVVLDFSVWYDET